MKRGIGELLVDNGQISPEELEKAQEERKKTGEPMSAVLDRLGLADENQVKNALELEYGVNYVPLKKLIPDPKTIGLVPETLVREYEAIPVSQEGARLTLAMVTPSNHDALDVFTDKLPSLHVKPVVCNEDDFWEFVGRAYALPEDTQPVNQDFATRTIDTTSMELEAGELIGLWRQDPAEEVPKDEPEDMAIILLSNHILSNAIAKGCSNIHIEPTERQVLVHYRKDGVLFAARRLPKAILPPLLRRYKKMAALSTTEDALPQDGHLHVQLAEQELSFRLTIVAGVRGEHLIIWLD